MTHAERREWDYIVVGTGAGGATLAARLAEAGMRVFVLEVAATRARRRARACPTTTTCPAFTPLPVRTTP